MPIEAVWKTLVCRGDGRDVGFAVLAGDAELDLKAYARVAGHKSAEIVPLKDVQPLTGYVRGGVTALAARKPYPVCVDEMIEAHDVVSVSAGVRGTQILLAPADYLRATSATVGKITR
jgi:Cys-tRNA(Pro)/Cys-tRNA(Cys) deacylase